MANRFWVGQSGGGNYNSTDWATTSGGTTGQLAPTSSDDVKFDGAGTFGNTSCTITATAAALTVIFSSGYTATLTIGANFTWTVSGNFTDHANHTWTVTSNAAGALTLNATCTIASGGKTFPGSVTLSGTTTTKTLSANWTVTGLVTLSGTTHTINATTSETLICAGGVSVLVATSTGTAKFVLTGGTWSGAQTLFQDIDLQGNVTISGIVQINSKTLTYVSGTITTTSSTLNIAGTGTTTINAAAVNWNAITTTSTATISLSAALNVTTLTHNLASTWTGVGAWTAANWVLANTTSATITLNHSVTYTVTTSITANKTVFNSTITITSDDGTLKAPLTLNNGATCNVVGNFTRIDASGGRAIYTFNGTVTTCNNIYSFNDALPPAISRVFGAAASY